MNPEIKSVRIPVRALKRSDLSVVWKLTLPRIVRRPDGVMCTPMGKSYIPISPTDYVSPAGTVRFD